MKKIKMQSIFFASLLTIACQSTPKVVKIEKSANVSEEIVKLQESVSALQDSQGNLLAPEPFKNAKEDLQNARSAREKGGDNADVLVFVEKGNAWLRQADQIASTRKVEFDEVLSNRSKAIEAGAVNFAGTELSRADNRLERETNTNSTIRLSLEQKKEIQDLYVQAHINALKNQYLSGASATIEKAKVEGAEKLIPATLSETQTKRQNAEVFLYANYYDRQRFVDMANSVNESANRLLQLTREARMNEKKSPEKIALEKEALSKDLASSQKNLNKEKVKLDEKEVELSNARGETTAFKNAASRDTAVRAMFSESEAEVITTDEGMIIRLKGLKFASGKAQLAPVDFQLLTKVSRAIAILGPTTLGIEGHTDAVGGAKKNLELSQKRAEVVMAYLESAENSLRVPMVSSGVGDQKPISSNKTAEGRALNRRVDVILTGLGKVSSTM